MVNVVVPILFEQDVAADTISIQGETVTITQTADREFSATVQVSEWAPLFTYAEGDASENVNVSIDSGIESKLSTALESMQTGGGLTVMQALMAHLEQKIYSVLKGVEIADTSFNCDYTANALATTVASGLRAAGAAAARQSLYEQLRAAGRASADMVNSETGTLDFEAGDELQILVKINHSALTLQFSSTLTSVPAQFSSSNADVANLLPTSGLDVASEYYKFSFVFA